MAFPYDGSWPAFYNIPSTSATNPFEVLAQHALNTALNLPPTPQTPSSLTSSSAPDPSTPSTSTGLNSNSNTCSLLSFMAPTHRQPPRPGAGPSFHLNLPPVYPLNYSWLPPQFQQAHAGFALPASSAFFSPPALPPQPKFHKGDQDWVRLLLDRTLVAYRKLDHVIANWTFAYHDRYFREYFGRAYSVKPAQIVCSKIISNEGYVFGIYVLADKAIAKSIVEFYELMLADNRVTWFIETTHVKITTSKHLLMQFSPSVKEANGMVPVKATNVEEAISDSFTLMTSPRRQQCNSYGQLRNVFYR